MPEKGEVRPFVPERAGIHPLIAPSTPDQEFSHRGEPKKIYTYKSEQARSQRVRKQYGNPTWELTSDDGYVTPSATDTPEPIPYPDEKRVDDTPEERKKLLPNIKNVPGGDEYDDEPSETPESLEAIKPSEVVKNIFLEKLLTIQHLVSRPVFHEQQGDTSDKQARPKSPLHGIISTEPVQPMRKSGSREEEKQVRENQRQQRQQQQKQR